MIIIKRDLYRTQIDNVVLINEIKKKISFASDGTHIRVTIEGVPYREVDISLMCDSSLNGLRLVNAICARLLNSENILLDEAMTYDAEKIDGIAINGPLNIFSEIFCTDGE